MPYPNIVSDIGQAMSTIASNGLIPLMARITSALGGLTFRLLKAGRLAMRDLVFRNKGRFPYLKGWSGYPPLTIFARFSWSGLIISTTVLFLRSHRPDPQNNINA